MKNWTYVNTVHALLTDVDIEVREIVLVGTAENAQTDVVAIKIVENGPRVPQKHHLPGLLFIPSSLLLPSVQVGGRVDVVSDCVGLDVVRDDEDLEVDLGDDVLDVDLGIEVLDLEVDDEDLDLVSDGVELLVEALLELDRYVTRDEAVELLELEVVELSQGFA